MTLRRATRGRPPPPPPPPLSLSLLLAIVEQASAQDPCTAEVHIEATPVYDIEVLVNGNIDPYVEEDLLIPKPVWLSARITEDTDRIFLKCLNQCVEIPIADDSFCYTWQLLPEQGYFVNSKGELVTFIENYEDVVYLPPRDLQPGETRSFVVNASVVDDGAGADQPCVATFQVEVDREFEWFPSKFAVTITPMPLDLNSDNQPCNAALGGCCVLVMTQFSQDTNPQVDLFSQDYPACGMATNALRAVHITAMDLDRVDIECGDDGCVNAHTHGQFDDSFTYLWEVQSGDVTIVESSGPTAIIKAGPTPGKIKLKITVEDALIENQEVIFEPEFLAYNLQFIDQANVPLSQIHGLAAGPEGLQVSLEITDQNMNGGGGGGIPDFDGPVGTDHRTYRVQARGMDLNADYTYRVRMQVLRAGAAYEGTNAYDRTFETEVQMDIIRSLHHVRLVSNVRPMPDNVPGGFVYDDELCPGVYDQTAYVHLGDWVKATLLVTLPTGQGEACSIDLPVERPWNEPNSANCAVPVPIKSCEIEWFVTEGYANNAKYPLEPHLSHAGSWGSALAYMTQRVSEDWAQSGLMFDTTSHNADAEYMENAIKVQRDDNGWPPDPTGTLVVHVVNEDKVVNLVAADTMETCANKIRDAVNQVNGYTAEVFLNRGTPNFSQPPDGYLVVVNRGGGDIDFRVKKNQSTSPCKENINNKPVNDEDLQLTNTDANLLGINYISPLGPGQDFWPVFIVGDNIQIFGDANRLAGTGTSSALDRFPGLAHATFLKLACADGWDGDRCQVLGHEGCHFLMDMGDPIHLPDERHLLTVAGPEPPGTTGAEGPANKKRLTLPRCQSARSARIATLPYLFKEPSIPIPDWK